MPRTAATNASPFVSTTIVRSSLPRSDTTAGVQLAAWISMPIYLSMGVLLGFGVVVGKQHVP
jgi:hypothetical protein